MTVHDRELPITATNSLSWLYLGRAAGTTTATSTTTTTTRLDYTTLDYAPQLQPQLQLQLQLRYTIDR